MTYQFSRRDFLKLVTALPLFHLAGRLELRELRVSDQPSIVIILLDALTARNMSLHGYSRNTTPNIEKFSERATVYHRHYAGFNGTAQSTASFFTGLYPWSHKVHNHYDIISRDVLDSNLYRQTRLGNLYHSFAYTDNLQADMILHQFSAEIDDHMKMGKMGEYNYMLHDLLSYKDGKNSLRGLDIQMLSNDSERLSGSLVGWVLLELIRSNHENIVNNRSAFPKEIGYSGNRRIAYTLENSIQNIKKSVIDLNDTKSPFIAYYHMFYPHAPYVPNKDFIGLFDGDGYRPVHKKPHQLLPSFHKKRELVALRRRYDAYIANIDYELGKLTEDLSLLGILDNCYFVITSDHGEMFERGKWGTVHL